MKILLQEASIAKKLEFVQNRITFTREEKLRKIIRREKVYHVFNKVRFVCQQRARTGKFGDAT